MPDQDVKQLPFHQSEVEEMAALMHRIWSGWAEWMMKVYSPQATERWTRQIATDYKDLSEKEKESDRVEARKVLGLMVQVKNENDRLRLLLAEAVNNGMAKCPYGMSDGAMMACRLGFPGCACADDLMIGLERIGMDPASRAKAQQARKEANVQWRCTGCGKLHDSTHVAFACCFVQYERVRKEGEDEDGSSVQGQADREGGGQQGGPRVDLPCSPGGVQGQGGATAGADAGQGEGPAVEDRD